ncbi:mobilome CxxCx(11)CxxC protein [Nocardia salmonicida]|uniref:mobilome CxxCx(11)CxxC protein n=1 Tax=Nocardia salmonicida TaxID=53431 RepID=UPI0037B7B39D
MTAPISSLSEQLREKAWVGALRAAATAVIFGRRVRIFTRRLNLLTFLSMAPALAVGGVALGGVEDLGLIVLIFGLAAVPVGLVGLWAAVEGWSRMNTAAIQSQAANLRLRDEYVALAERGPADEAELQRLFDLLATRDQGQRDRDVEERVKDKEKTFGMRAALRERGKECASCSVKPTDMKPTDCGVCGVFPKWWRQ